MIILMVLMANLIGRHQVSGLELKYKVCTAEELRRSIEQFCMRLGRDGGSLLSLGPYGSVSTKVVDVNSEGALLEVLRLSKPYARQRAGRMVGGKPRKLSQQLFKRDQDSFGTELCNYLDSCCNQSCVIDPEDLAPYCTAI